MPSERGEVGWDTDIQEQAKARNPWVKLGICCSLAQALGRLDKWLGCQGGNSDLKHESVPWHGCRWTGQTHRLLLLPEGEVRKVWISPVLGKDGGSGLSCLTPSAAHNSV